MSDDLTPTREREAPCRHCGSDWHYTDEHGVDPNSPGAALAGALMAANYPGDSGEDVDRLIEELAKRGYTLAATPTPDDRDRYCIHGERDTSDCPDCGLGFITEPPDDRDREVDMDEASEVGRIADALVAYGFYTERGMVPSMTADRLPGVLYDAGLRASGGKK